MKKIKTNGKDDPARDRFSSHFLSIPEFEGILEWVRLNVSLLRNSPAFVESHRQCLRARGETEQRLSDLPHWHQSPEFTKREKAALNLSEIISLHERDELSASTCKDARRHLNVDEIIRLRQTVVAINDRIDLREK
jgi:alkylhydroperoxidase family enzyme